MKFLSTSLFIFVLFFILPCYANLASNQSFQLDDSDLSTPLTKRSQEVLKNDLSPTQIISEVFMSNHIKVEQFIEKEGELRPIEFMDFELQNTEEFILKDSVIPCQNNQDIHFAYQFKTPHFKIQNRNGYQLNITLQCGQHYQLIYKFDSIEGEVMGVWDIAQRAVNKFKEIDLLDFWKNQITFKFPADGDYYQSFNKTVSITKGYQWDIVGHELGHGIYDMAKIGAAGGGAHKIDQCYSNALALSEGWASYFSAWLSVDLNDPDAKFEYMVPRRSPIEFEHIPSDVCKGQGNEWRVTGFFWDLIDLNNDGEEMEQSFQRIFNITKNAKMKEAKDLVDLMIKDGIDSMSIQNTWDLNFN